MNGIHDSLRALSVPMESLTPDPANARKHGQRSIEAIRASLRTFGQRKPIVVQREGMRVRAGNGLYEAARTLGWTEIAAVIVDEDNVSATAFAIADNRTAETSEWDDEALASIVREIDFGQIDGFSLDAIGFSPEELAELTIDPQEFSEFERERKEREGQEDAKIVLFVPKKCEAAVLQWINGAGPYNASALGKAILEKCGLR